MHSAGKNRFMPCPLSFCAPSHLQRIKFWVGNVAISGQEKGDFKMGKTLLGVAHGA